MLDEVVADGDDHVGVLEARERIVARLKADRAERARVLVVEHPLAHEGLRHADARRVGERAQSGGGPGPGHAVAGQHDRPLGFPDDLLGRAELLGAGLRPAAAVADRERYGVDGRGHDVLGQLDVGRPRLLRLGDLERLAHHLGDHARRVQPRVELGDGPQHVDDVEVLVRLLVHALEVGLAGERDHRRAVEQGVGDAGHEVGGARPQRPEADPRRAREAAVHVGHVGAALLVADGDELDARCVERLVEIQRLFARDAEYVLDALGLEALHEQIRRLALAHLRNFLPGSVSGYPEPLAPARFADPRGARAARHARLRREGPLHDPRRRLRPRSRDEPVRRLRVRPAGPHLRPDPGPLLHRHGARDDRSGRHGARTDQIDRHGDRQRRRARRHAQARSRPHLQGAPPRRHAGRPAVGGRQADRHLLVAAPDRRAGRRGHARRGRRLPRHPRVPARHLRRRERDQRGLARGLHRRRRRARVALVVAGRGAEGAGRRRAHLRDHHLEGRRGLRALRRHALAGLRRRGRRDAVHQPGGGRHARAGRHLRRRAGRHLLLLHLRRADRERGEHERRRRAPAVAEVGRGPVRPRVAQAPLGADQAHPRPGGRQARRARQGPLPRHPGHQARALAADRERRHRRHRRPHARRRRDAARPPRPARHVGLLHVDREPQGAADRHRRHAGRRRRPAGARLGGRHRGPGARGRRGPDPAPRGRQLGEGRLHARAPRRLLPRRRRHAPAPTARSSRATPARRSASASPCRRAPASGRRRRASRRPRPRRSARA